MLPNVSRSEGNQAIKFAKLIECITRNVFLEKSSAKYAEKLVPGPFLKIKIDHISGSIV